ncbi:winged helix-turn-helix domain-containing protein [Streptomyces spiralis]|uniref:winged helix-turn-helix domain-containing protein n=1 Tax=Streptomyces spiralis TaxID=66376 RepID=UPI0035E5D6C3
MSPEGLWARPSARLEAELRRGPSAHEFADLQWWTLKLTKVVIGRLFHVGCTVQGVRKQMRRHGWSCQVSLHRAIEGTRRPSRCGSTMADQMAYDRCTELGLSRSEFAERCGVKQPQISRIEGAGTVRTIPLRGRRGRGAATAIRPCPPSPYP